MDQFVGLIALVAIGVVVFVIFDLGREEGSIIKAVVGDWWTRRQTTFYTDEQLRLERGRREADILLKDRDVDMTRMSNEERVVVADIQAKSAREVEQLRQAGSLGGRYLEVLRDMYGQELTADEAKKVRRFEAREHAKDRKLKRQLQQMGFDQELARIQQETRSRIEQMELEFRYKYPSADLEAQQSLIRLKGQLAEIEHIMSIPDAKQREVAFRQWERTKK